jgi:hypothetical protein
MNNPVVSSVTPPAPMLTLVAVNAPDSVTLNGALPGVAFPAKNLISSAIDTMEDIPTTPAVSVITPVPIVQPLIVADPAMVTLPLVSQVKFPLASLPEPLAAI